MGRKRTAAQRKARKLRKKKELETLFGTGNEPE
jgi:hypothetical protein